MLIQIHMLQNYAPSNLNRDNTGSPKDAFFGGTRRGRISSQCLKRSIRRSQVFAESLDDKGLIAQRTNRLPRLIDEKLKSMGVDEADRRAIVSRLPEIGKREGSGESGSTDEGQAGGEEELKTRILVLLTDAEAGQLAERMLATYREQGAKEYAKMKITDLEKAMRHDMPRSVDVAMFGRMTTSVAFEDVSAAVQVAHALSANALNQEFDYFTAVDDISGETGAGMIGDVEFNSSTYYKYLNVYWEDLVKNLGDDPELAKKSVAALIKAAIFAHPSGKQNSFAAFNLPDLVLVEVTPKNIPVSYANAFLKPVRHTHQTSLIEESVAALSDYTQRLAKKFSLKAERAALTVTDTPFSGASEVESVEELLEWVSEKVTEISERAQKTEERADG